MHELISTSQDLTHVLTTGILSVVIGALLVVIHKMHLAHTKAMLLVTRDYLEFIRTRPVVKIKVGSDKDAVFQPIERVRPSVETGFSADLEKKIRNAPVNAAIETNLYGGVPS